MNILCVKLYCILTNKTNYVALCVTRLSHSRLNWLCDFRRQLLHCNRIRAGTTCGVQVMQLPLDVPRSISIFLKKLKQCLTI
jgi:hypothetical protein